MALIQPNGKIQLFNNLKLDASYEHTYYWESAAAQSSFFAGKVVVEYDNQSYTRKNRSIKVQAVADNIYSCNYLRFQNNGFGQKWFYAFITDIEYISNTVAEIFYEIDVIQTWYFNFSLNGSFVERIHTQSDDYFEHIEPDISPFGDDYVFTKRQYENFSSLKACLQATTNPAGSIRGITRNNIYSQLHVIDGISITDETELNKIINEDYVGRYDAIINVFEYPDFLDDGDGGTPVTATAPASKNVNFAMERTVLDNHTIVNKKCLCFPYNYLVVSNNQGADNILRFEDFTNAATGTVGFTVKGVKFPTPELMLYPKSHKRIADDYENGVFVKNFPTCCFSGNVYTNYLAQNQNSIAVSQVTGLASAITNTAGAIKGKNPGAIGDSIMDAVNYYAGQLDMMHLPATCKGQLNSVGLQASLNRYGFTLYQKCLSTPLIRQIDNFFTRYGYAINRIVNNVNRAARTKFTYVKLRNASIYGNVPAADCRKIEELHNRGITYWKSTATIGDFTDNNPTS